jgi:glycosyltransferase involved in cell wall biosynthesis
MNFLFLNSAKQWGGNENWIALASTALSELNHTSVIAYRSQQVGARFPGTKIKLPFYSEMDIITLFSLLKILRKYRVDVIISTKQKDYFLGGLTAKIYKIPNIIRLGIVRPLNNSWSKKLLYDKLCDGIIVNARRIKETLLQSSFVQPNKICLVYNGVNITTIVEKSEQFTIKKPSPFLIVTSGMLIKRKGFDYLLTAFARFLHTHTIRNAGLLILGSGEEQENLRRLSRNLGIDRYTIFQGYQQNPFPYLKQGDCFVITSENEGLANALLEAMALGIPVITTPSGGVTEVIKDGENGYIVNREDVPALVNRIQQLYTQIELRRNLAQKAYQTIQKQFSPSVMANKIIDFCSEILISRKK